MEIWKSLSNPTSINSMSIWSKMGCSRSSPCWALTTKINLETYLLKIMWKSILRASRGVLMEINIWFIIWHDKEHTQGKRFHMLFFRSYWNWCHWQKLDLRSMLPPWIQLFMILYLFGGDSEPFEVYQTQGSTGGECCIMLWYNIVRCW